MGIGQPDVLKASESTLFLGAGFSAGAKNIRGNDVPTGEGLRLELAKLLADETTEASLSELAELCRRNDQVDVYQLLYNSFTITAPTADQLAILQLPWRRIYTTNYDDCVEHCRNTNRLPVNSFSYFDPKPNKVADGAIIHLHGYIRATNREDAKNQLVLDETSYAKQHFVDSPWYREFDRDITHSRAVFFLGYGLKDHKIASLLMQSPSIATRTYFVTRKNFGKPFAAICEPYGSIAPIEISGFSQLCRTLPEPDEANPRVHLGTFKHLDPFLDKKALNPPTPPEIRDLIIRGSFNHQRCLSTLPQSTYVVPRNEMHSSAISLLKDNRSLLVHSRIGNGKTIFLHMLSYFLNLEKYNCYWCRGREFPGAVEINRLAAIDRVVLIIDSYDLAVEFLPELQTRLPNAKFVVSVRTGIHDVRLHEIRRDMPTPLSRLSLNSLDADDKLSLTTLLNSSGLRTEELEAEVLAARDIRDVVLRIYKNKSVKEQLHAELERPLQNRDFRSAMVAMHVLKSLGVEVEQTLLRQVAQCDPIQVFSNYGALSTDVFSVYEEVPHYHSSILSEFLMEEFFSIGDVLDVVERIVLITAPRRKESRRDRAILGTAMQYSSLKRLLQRRADFSIGSLTDFYSRLYRDIHVNAQPLFWLQYAIAMTDAKNLHAAQDAIVTAYKRAEDEEGFRTFQIDTFSVKLDLLVEQSNKGSMSDERFSKLMRSFQTVAQMIASDSNRFHAIDVLAEVEPFVVQRVADLRLDQMRQLVSEIDAVNARLFSIPDQMKSEVGSEMVRLSLLRARDRLSTKSAA